MGVAPGPPRKEETAPARVKGNIIARGGAMGGDDPGPPRVCARKSRRPVARSRAPPCVCACACVTCLLVSSAHPRSSFAALSCGRFGGLVNLMGHASDRAAGSRFCIHGGFVMVRMAVMRLTSPCSRRHPPHVRGPPFSREHPQVDRLRMALWDVWGMGGGGNGPAWDRPAKARHPSQTTV
jgi:hypothetical protein